MATWPITRALSLSEVGGRRLVITSRSVLVRGLEVATRLPDQVAAIDFTASGGALLETMLGRYLLNHDGRQVWQLIDGRRQISEIADALSAQYGLELAAAEVLVSEFCQELVSLRLAHISPTSPDADADPDSVDSQSVDASS